MGSSRISTVATAAAWFVLGAAGLTACPTTAGNSTSPDPNAPPTCMSDQECPGKECYAVKCVSGPTLGRCMYSYEPSTCGKGPPPTVVYERCYSDSECHPKDPCQDAKCVSGGPEGGNCVYTTNLTRCPPAGSTSSGGTSSGGTSSGGTSSGGTSSGGTSSGAPPACVPSGATGQPTIAELSPASVCVDGEIYLSGQNTGGKCCITINGVTFESNSGFAIIPAGIAPGTYTLTAKCGGGETTKSITITAGNAPVVKSVGPAAAGATLTITGTGFTGFTGNLTVSLDPPAVGSRSVPIKSNDGTTVTVDLPADLAAGKYHIDFFKANCGLSSAKFTL